MRECPCCGNPLVEQRNFKFEALTVGAIACPCGISMSIPVQQVEAAWNQRKVTDELLRACLAPLRTIIKFLSDSGVEAIQEKRLVDRIAAHLSGGQL